MTVKAGVFPDRYERARPIGHGGMGEIFSAEDRELGRRVAIKVLDARFAGNDQLKRRFKREALTAARLSGHPHVVTIFDVGESDGQPFIVMEYLPGGTLGDRARSAPVGPEQAIAWLAQAAEALDDAHALGIVHRDVKPANLLFDARNSLVVADFGIARIADDTTGGMTAAGTVLGTAGYLSPEQALGDPATAASDRYALAVVAYELLTGGRPFERGSSTAEAAAHINEPVPPASQRGVGLPAGIDSVFARSLAKNPSARYPTAAAFVEALQHALSPLEEATRTLPIFPAPRPARGKPVPMRRRGPAPWVPVLLAAVVLALVGGVAAAVFATGGSEPAAATVPSKPEQVTVTKKVTKTEPGATVTQKVITTVQTGTPAPAPGAGPVSVEEAVQLTDQSTYALRRGDWEEAVDLARRAYRPLVGTYSGDFRYEAYLTYDLGKALAELGRCPQALRYLDRSEELQGSRREIDEARSKCGR